MSIVSQQRSQIIYLFAFQFAIVLRYETWGYNFDVIILIQKQVSQIAANMYPVYEIQDCLRGPFHKTVIVCWNHFTNFRPSSSIHWLSYNSRPLKNHCQIYVRIYNIFYFNSYFFRIASRIWINTITFSSFISFKNPLNT